MVSFRTAMGLALCIALAVMLSLGCNTKKSTSTGPGSGPQEPAGFIPHNPGTVNPEYGEVAGATSVTVVLPVDFEAEVGETQVYFGDVANGILGNEATNLFIDPYAPWYVNCTVPQSFDGTKQVVDVIVVNPPDGDVGPAVFPPQGSVVLEGAYTYINEQSEVILLARDTFPAEAMTDLVATDYNDDGWPDVVGRHPTDDLLVFIKNDMGSLVQEKTLPMPPAAAEYTGLIAGNVNGDALDDLVVHGLDGFVVLKNNASSPGTYEETVYTGLRSGTHGAIVDMNLDGFGDLVLGGRQAIRVFSYTEDTGLYDRVMKLPGHRALRGLSVGDVDGNGKADIITITDEPTGWYLNWYLNDLVGTWNEKAIIKQHPRVLVDLVVDEGIVNLKTADLNGDQLADVVFSGADDEVTTIVGALASAVADGKGSFGEVKYQGVPGIGKGVTGARDLVLMDADKDMNQDVLVLVAGWNSVILYQGDGAGNLDMQGTQAVGKNAVDLVGLDVNKDGKPDLVSSEAGIASYLENMAGDLLFRDAEDHFLDWFPTRVVAGDLDGDRYPDLVIMDAENDMVAVLINDGEGGFYKLKEIPVGGGTLTSLCLFHSSRENEVPDLALIATNGTTDPGTLTVLVSDGTELFTVSIQIPVGPNPLEIVAEDVNNDGSQDLTVVQNGGDSLALFLSDGKDGFDKIEERSPITLPVGVTLAVLDNDFDLDGVVASPFIQTLYVLPTDVNGSLNLGAGASMLDAMGEASNTAASDYSLDGYADIASNAGATVNFFVNDGFRNFTFQGSRPLSGEASSLEAIDLNFDHQGDLSAAVPGGVDLLMNKSGDLNRVSTTSVNGFKSRARMLWIDVNGDLLPELVLPSEDEKKLSVVFNASVEIK